MSTFPNISDKYKMESIATPNKYKEYAMGNNKYPTHNTPEAVIICYNNDLMKYVIENHTNQVSWFHGEMYFINDTNDRIGIVGNFGIGAPISCAILEELIALGVQKFISIGTAGSLQKYLNIGDFVVCNKAIRDEGTSYHYAKPSKYAYASEKLTNRILKSFDKFNQKYVLATSWTTDAPYRETITEVKQYQKEGVATVEMEASALFTVANYRNVELTAIFTISDSLAELEWKPKFYAKQTQDGLETIFKIAMEGLSVND